MAAKSRAKSRSASTPATARRLTFVACTVKSLPSEMVEAARQTAIQHNPANDVNLEQLAVQNGIPMKAMAALLDVLDPQRIAALTQKYWGKQGVKLGVSFLDNPTAGTRRKILVYANKWGERCNIVFQESAQGQVRIARADDGYWSYLGTDILHIPAGEATMNLQGFTETSPRESEWDRVVTHEFGHTCGCPHEHSRQAIIDLLDPQKTIAYFQRTQGWPARVTKQQVLTPVEEKSIMGGPTEQDSIMCYSFPGECTKNGRPIPGGAFITEGDYAWMAKLYPKADLPGPGSGEVFSVKYDTANRVATIPVGWTARNE